MRSEARDAALLEAREDAESQRSAAFYHHPYVVDASRQYLMRQKLYLQDQARREEANK